MKTLKIGLIGLGEWPRRAYVPALKELDTAEVAAVAARSVETRQYAREQFGDGLKTYADYGELLADESIEAVMLALPNTLHSQAIKDALASGKHIFCEPPLAHDAEEIAGIVNIMETCRQAVQLNLELRYLPVIAAVKRLLDSGEVGQPMMSKVRLLCNWRRGVQGQQNDNERRGFFPWLSCWYLDLLDCVFPAMPLRASVSGAYASGGSLMDHGFATLEYCGGGIGQFEFFLLGSDSLSITLEIFTTDGEISADIVSGNLSWRKTGSPRQCESHPAASPAYGFEGMRECIEAFVDAALAGNPLPANARLARRIHAGMTACMVAEESKQTVVVEN